MNRRDFLIGGVSLAGLAGCAAGFGGQEGFSAGAVSVPDLAPYGTLLVYYAPFIGDFTVSGQSVATWRDRSGNTNNASESTNRPTLMRRSLRKSPAPDFDGTNDTLAAGTAFTQTQLSIFCVVQIHTVPGFECDILTARASGTAGWSLGFTSGKLVRARNYNAATSNNADIDLSTSFSADKWFLIEAHFGASSYFSVANGNESSVRSDTFDVSTQPLTMALPINGSGASALDGQIGLVAVYNAQLSSANRAAVRNILRERYQIY